MVIIADGWASGTFQDLLQRGELPEFRDWMRSRACLIENVISVVPTASIASHSTLLTGRPPRDHGIYSHLWVERQTRRLRNYQTSGYLRINSDLSSDVSTVFEHYPYSAAIQSLVTRGAHVSSKSLTQNTSRLLDRLRVSIQRRPVGIHVCWLPKGDTMAHIHGPKSESVAKEMKLASKGVGRVLEEIDSLGLSEDVAMLMVPDHGHRDSTRPTFLTELESFVEKEFHAWLMQVNPLIARRVPPDSFAALSNGGSSLYIYPPSNITDNYIEDLIDALGGSELFDLVVGQTSSVSHRLASRSGNASLQIEDESTTANYKLLGGNDPLGLTGERSSTLDLTHPLLESPYPDFLAQYLDSLVLCRSPAIMAFSKAGRYFTAGPRIAWRFGFHRGSHGGPRREEVVVQALAQSPLLPSQAIVMAPVRSKDLLKVCGILPAHAEPEEESCT